MSDRYEDRPSLDDLIERHDIAEIRRWWPKMSGRDREAVKKGVRMRSADILGWSRFFATLTDDESDEDVPLDPAEEHCARVSSRRDVRLWHARLERPLADMPKDVWLLVTDQTMTVYANPPDSDDPEISRDLEIRSLTSPRVMTHKHDGFTGR